MKCFYHGDLDGRCAGAVVAHFTGDYNAANYFEVDFAHPLPVDKIGKDELLYIVDFAFSEVESEGLYKVLERTKNVVWIDHHSSSIKFEKTHPELKKIDGIRKDGISGAALTYMYFKNCKFEEIPYFIQLVSCYDCWQHEQDPNCLAFKYGMDCRPFDALDDVWGSLFGIFRNIWVNRIIKQGKAVEQYIIHSDAFYLKAYGYESEIAGLPCYVINKKSNSKIFGNKFYEYPIVIVWVFDGNQYVYSVFSDSDDVDCAEIAESYGGGGHKHAAGFQSTKLLFKEVKRV